MVFNQFNAAMSEPDGQSCTEKSEQPSCFRDSSPYQV
jgi:hypothetical protein